MMVIVVVILVIVLLGALVAVVRSVIVKVGLVAAVVVTDVVVRTLVWCAGTVTDTFIAVLTFDVRVDVLIIVSDMAVGLLMDALTSVTCGIRTNFDVDVFASAITVFRFALPGP